jgi:WD40 repeat protein/serine/threonine protein kinase/tetratricopeptide (TPR) repeat protein
VVEVDLQSAATERRRGTMPADLKRVKEIFLAALEKSSATEREAFLLEVCGADQALRDQVGALLRQHEQGSDFLESPPPGLVQTVDSDRRDGAVPGSSAAGSAAAVGSRIGPYKLLQELGEGGMGTVFLAEQAEPVKRRVALKVIKAGMDSAHVIARFEQERQALAMMDHPNIAKVLDAGTVGQVSNLSSGEGQVGNLPHGGRPYFVMELVKGIKITDYCDQEHLTPKERLELFIPVCQAVQHAHQKGIIHRDLKPSNVLIALYDGKPIPKVIDFGVAKATAQKLTERTMFTEVGQIVGTLEYMSPEQAELNNLDIDTRADIYSLGVLLYELLTGSPPFTAKQLRRAAFTEMLRMIREVEPPRPSTKLSSSEELPTIAANRKLDPKKLTKLVHGDLDWIAMKCLEKERGRRYETANGLAMDVQRYLTDEPVLAGPPSAGYRLRKFLRRNKRPVLAASIVLLALIGGVIGTTWGMVNAEQAQAEAQANERKAKQAAEAEGQAKKKAQKEEKNAKTERLRAQDKLVRLYVNTGGQRRDEGDLLGSLPWFVAALKEEQGGPDAEAIHRWRLGASLRLSPKLVQLWAHDEPVSLAELSSDGRRVLLVSGPATGRTAQVWDAATGAAIGPPLGDKVGRASFSPDGNRVLTVSDYMARVWDVATGKLVAPPIWHGETSEGKRGTVTNARFSPDGRRIVTVSGPMGPMPTKPSPSARVWDVATSQPVTEPLKYERSINHSAVFSPDGSRLFTWGVGPAPVWDVATSMLVCSLPNQPRDIRNASFSPDGRRLITVGENGTAQVWDATTGRPVAPTIKPRGSGPYESLDPRFCGAFSPDGRHVATAGRTGTVQVWDALTGQPVTRPLEHRGPVEAVAFSRDGRRLVTASSDRTARVWDAVTGELVACLHHSGAVGLASFSPDGRHVLTAGADRTARLWDLAGIQAPCPLSRHGTRLVMLEVRDLRPDLGRAVVRVGSQAQVWDVVAARPVAPPLKHNGKVVWPRFSPDGRRVATASDDRTARVWDAVTGKPVTAPLPHKDKVYDVQFSPDGRRVVTASGDSQRVRLVSEAATANARVSEARVWDAATGKPLTPPLAMAPGGRPLFSPEGRWLVTESNAPVGGVQVWDAATGRPVTTLPKKDGGGRPVAVSPDSRLLLILTGYRAMVWDIATGKQVYPTHQVPDEGPRGTMTMQVHIDAVSGKLYDLLPLHGIPHAAFSPDSRRLLTTNDEGTSQVWDLATGQPVGDPMKHAAMRSQEEARFSPDGRRVVTASFDQTARVWDAQTGKPVTPPLQHRERVLTASFSDDGRRVTTGSYDGTARVWDAATGEPLTPPLPAGEWVWHVCFSPDDRRVFVNRTQVWELPRDDRPAEDLSALAQLLAGHRVDQGGLAPAEPKVLRAAWQKLRQKYPQDFVTSDRELRAWHRREAAGLMKARRWQDALVHLDALIGQDVTDAEIWHEKGHAQFCLEQHDQAIRSFSKAIALCPEHDAAWVFRGFSHAYLGKAGEALRDFTRAIKLDPGSATTSLTLLLRGRVYVASGQWDKAIADYAAALNWPDIRLGNPKEVMVLNVAIPQLSAFLAEKPDHWQAWFHRGVAHGRLGQWDRALADYSRAIALNPDDWRPWAERGRIYLQREQWDRAAADFSNVIERKPKDLEVRERRIQACTALAQWDTVIVDCTAILEQKPGDEKAWHDRSGAYIALGQWATAITHCRSGSSASRGTEEP